MDNVEFEQALRAHYDDALRYCHSLAAKTSYTDAEDLLQESLLKALRKYYQLLDKAKFRPWFFQIITRTYISHTRLASWKRLIRMTPAIAHIPEVYAGYEMTGPRTTILKALAQLPVKQRAAFLLFELGGFSLEEIRIIQQDRSLSAVKSRLSRARKKLKDYILKLERNQAKSRRVPVINDLDYEIHRTTEQALKQLNGR